MVNLAGCHFEDLHPLCSETSLTYYGADYVFVDSRCRLCPLCCNLQRRFRVHQCSFGGAERNVALHR